VSAQRRKHRRPPERGLGAHGAEQIPRRRGVLLWVVVGLAVVAGAGAVFRGPLRRGVLRLAGGAKRNVLLITVDTTRADHLGCYGRTNAQTPNMDRLAREGVLFRRCSTCSVQTLPSHCTIMTGLYPYVHGVRRNGTEQLPPAAVTLAEVLKQAGFATAAAVSAYVLDPRFGIAQGFDTYHAVPPPRPGSDPAYAQRKGDEVVKDALELLHGLAGQRFFLWVHFYDPHYPYESARIPDPQSPDAYADEIAFMDTQIGRLLDELRALNLDDRTLVVLVGDHGEGLNDHDEFQHGFFVHETDLHVPLLMRCPGLIPAGRQVGAVVRTVDITPTVLDLLASPALPDSQGVSLRTLVRGEREDLQLAAYGEAPEPHTLFRLSRLRTLTVGDWKYVLSSQPHLYDVAHDPAEAHDLSEEKADLATALRDQLRTLIADAPPVIAGETHVDLASNEVARLESLGYLGVVSDPNEAGLSELDTFEPQEPDPQPYAAILSQYEHARDELGHGRLGPAESQLRQVTAALPRAPAPLRDLAYVLARQRKTDEAAALYERVLALTPADSRTRVQYASMLMDAQRWQAAMAQATQVLAEAPGDFAAHSMLGVAYATLGRLDEAQAHLEAAVRAEPRNPNALHALGQVYYKRGLLAQAAECFRRALAAEPRFAPARAALQAVEQAMRK
jgi:arylsulfatase A-like enzyme/Flp pilus assembly protein TadD